MPRDLSFHRIFRNLHKKEESLFYKEFYGVMREQLPGGARQGPSAISGLSATLLQAPFCPLCNFLVRWVLSSRLSDSGRGERSSASSPGLCACSSNTGEVQGWQHSSGYRVLHSVFTASWENGMEGRERSENMVKKSTVVTQNRCFGCQTHEHGTKVKIIPGAPYCYSYNSLFRFQQVWVSVLIERQNKLKGN